MVAVTRWIIRCVLVLKAVVVVMTSAPTSHTRYGFYRDMRDAGNVTGGTRRVFGGSASSLDSFPGACALLDRYWSTRCSCAVIAPRWALTAAHCISTRLAYVKFNTRRPGSTEGDVVPVHYLYRHPNYEVLQQDLGRGSDVTVLHHDVGLVRTRSDMKLATSLRMDPLQAITLYNPRDLANEEVVVFGFGRTQRSSVGEELFSVRLQVSACERDSWYHCICAAWRTHSAGWGGEPRDIARGVCSGDSGGPVVYRGVQIAITSMGPLECGARGHTPPEGATSVFTSLYKYAKLVNATILDTEAEMRMNMISSVHPLQSSLLFLLLLLLS